MLANEDRLRGIYYMCDKYLFLIFVGGCQKLLWKSCTDEANNIFQTELSQTQQSNRIKR